MTYCILRTKKIKSRADLTKVARHNFRLRKERNVTGKRSVDNIVLYNPLNIDITQADAFQKSLSKKYEELKVEEKTGNVFAMEFMVTASPEYFFKDIKGWSASLWDKLQTTNPSDKIVIDQFWSKVDKNKINNYFKEQLEFFKKEFGDSVENMVLHLDEKSPHAHIIVNTAVKSVKKFKNRYGSGSRESYSLNAKRFDREYLKGLHNRYAEWNSKFGLKRGKEGSTDVHKKIKEYHDKSTIEIMKLLLELEQHRNVESQMKISLPKIKKKMDSYSEGIKVLLDIIAKKQLTNEEIEKIENIYSIVKTKKSTLKV